nr:reverse transcriptase domain-containing protein [Tanacetum cinerariifolium]
MRRIGKDFSGRDTPLFPTMLVPAREEELGEDEAVNEEMYDRLERATTTATSLDAEQDRGGGLKHQDTIGDTIAQTRVKRLGKKRRSRTHGLKRLYKVSLSARVESSAKEHSLGKKNASKQGRNIADIDVDAEITLVNETVEDQGRYNDQEMFDTNVLNDEEVVVEDVKVASIATDVTVATTVVFIDDITLAQALMDIKTQSPGKSFDEQEARRLQSKFDEQDRLTEEKAQQIKDENLAWDNVQAMMDANYELAARLHEEEQGELTIEEKLRLFIDLELKPLPDYLEYAYLEKDSLLPVIKSSLIKEDEKERLVFVLENHKEAFAWKTSNIPAISLSFCKHKINLEKASPASAVYHMVFLCVQILSALKNESDFSTPFERNRLSVANFLLRVYTSLSILGGSKSMTSLAFKGLALIPGLEMRFLMNGPSLTSKKNFFRLSFILMDRSLSKEDKINDNFPDETLDECHHGPNGGHYGPSTTTKKVFDAESGNLSRRDEMPQNIIQDSEVFDISEIDFMVISLNLGIVKRNILDNEEESSEEVLLKDI